MPFDLALLFPLLGGYLLVSYSNFWAYDMARKSGHRLLFHAALAGVLLAILARIVVLATIAWFPEVAELWKTLAPFRYSGTAFGSLILGGALIPVLNAFRTREEAIRTLIMKRDADALERLLYRAWEDQGLVQLTLDNEKVYVGLVAWTPPNPNAKDAYICIVPMLSGYRDPAFKTLHFTTSYTDVYADLASATDGDDMDMSAFLKVIPISKIYLASLFDAAAYERFNRIEGEAGEG